MIADDCNLHISFTYPVYFPVGYSYNFSAETSTILGLFLYPWNEFNVGNFITEYYEDTCSYEDVLNFHINFTLGNILCFP